MLKCLLRKFVAPNLRIYTMRGLVANSVQIWASLGEEKFHVFGATNFYPDNHSQFCNRSAALKLQILSREEATHFPLCIFSDVEVPLFPVFARDKELG